MINLPSANNIPTWNSPDEILIAFSIFNLDTVFLSKSFLPTTLTVPSLNSTIVCWFPLASWIALLPYNIIILSWKSPLMQIEPLSYNTAVVKVPHEICDIFFSPLPNNNCVWLHCPKLLLPTNSNSSFSPNIAVCRLPHAIWIIFTLSASPFVEHWLFPLLPISATTPSSPNMAVC